MSNLIVIENKISETRKYLTILERYKQYSQEKIVNDIDIKGALVPSRSLFIFNF